MALEALRPGVAELGSILGQHSVSDQEVAKGSPSVTYASDHGFLADFPPPPRYAIRLSSLRPCVGRRPFQGEEGNAYGRRYGVQISPPRVRRVAGAGRDRD